VMEQVHADVQRLAMDYPQRPLGELLPSLVECQDTIYTLLERQRRPAQARQLYFLAGTVGGLLAKASHDMADPHAALTQARTAFVCAENADHNGLRAWIRGIQSLVSYWAGRTRESVRYAQSGADFAALARSTTSVWLPVSEARAWAALGNAEQARAAIERAERAWDSVDEDEVDELGGLCTFGRTRQIYYAADALSWLPSLSEAAQTYAVQAVEAYEDTSNVEWAFGDQAGSRADLAIARLQMGELEGAVEAVTPVLDLEPDQRINGIVHSAKRVHQALRSSSIGDAGAELQEQIEAFTRTPLRSLPQ
jgi:tetratricopeptide (TPR) repeat protein